MMRSTILCQTAVAEPLSWRSNRMASQSFSPRLIEVATAASVDDGFV